MERKKIGRMQGRISMKRLVCNSTVKCIIINLHTKYDFSSLHGSTEIFDKNLYYLKYGKKKNGQVQGRISMRRLIRNPTIQCFIINLHTKYDYSGLDRSIEISDETFYYSKYIGKKIGQMQGRISMRSLVCNFTVHCFIINRIQNMTTLPCTVI